MEQAFGVPSVQTRVISAVRPSSRSGDTGRPTIATPMSGWTLKLTAPGQSATKPMANLSPTTGRLCRWNLSTKALAISRVTGTTRSLAILVPQFRASLPLVSARCHALFDPVLSTMSWIHGPARAPARSAGTLDEIVDLHLITPAYPRTRGPSPIATRPRDQNSPGPATLPCHRDFSPADSA